MPIGPGNLNDRLEVCWSHLGKWEDHELARESRDWLVAANAKFSPSTFIAYQGNQPAGMIEFMPRDMLEEQDLCPCRQRKGGTGDVLPSLGMDFRDYLFITCLWVPTQFQGRGIGKALLGHLLDSQTFKHFRGALVYVADRDPTWPDAIHWPAGPKEFYEEAGFTTAKRVEEPSGYLMRLVRMQKA